MKTKSSFHWLLSMMLIIATTIVIPNFATSATTEKQPAPRENVVVMDMPQQMTAKEIATSLGMTLAMRQCDENTTLIQTGNIISQANHATATAETPAMEKMPPTVYAKKATEFWSENNMKAGNYQAAVRYHRMMGNSNSAG